MLAVSHFVVDTLVHCCHQRAMSVHDCQSETLKRFESSGWKSPYQSEADAMDQAHRLQEQFSNDSLTLEAKVGELDRDGIYIAYSIVIPCFKKLRNCVAKSF